MLSALSLYSAQKPQPHNTFFVYGTHLGLHRNPTANISFLRRFFSSGVNPAMSAAARTKAQGIINENAVGMCLRCEDQILGEFIH